MDSMPKRHKPLDEAQTGGETLTLAHDDVNVEEEDRIGNLPDSILCHILRKLPTKDALGTAVLSTRWKHLFSQIPNLSLVIADTLLRHPNSSPVNCNNNSSFINFMYHLLTVTLHDTPHIHSFYFHSHRDYGNTHIDAWISAVVRLNVEHIALSFESKISGVSPHSNIFRSTTLLHLALSQHCVLTLPSSVCLQNLKSILFTSLKITDAVSVERVLAGCPVLQTLFLDGCEFGDMEILCISSPSLKHFLMDNCHHESAYELVLDTPNLELLNYTDLVARGYSLKNLKSLVKAYIDIGPIEEQMEEAPPLFEEKVANFVTACSETALLYLSEDSISAIHYSYRPMPTFHNLRKLKLGGVKSSGWQLLPHLLDRSPSLQVIVFMEGFSEHEGCYTRFQDCLPEFGPVCLSLHLRKVKVEEFKGNQDELKLIEYFLKTAQVLQKVKISSAHLYSEKQLCIWKKLFMLPRCSKNCQIELAELK